jgi:hypothetical protein
MDNIMEFIIIYPTNMEHFIKEMNLAVHFSF